MKSWRLRSLRVAIAVALCVSTVGNSVRHPREAILDWAKGAHSEMVRRLQCGRRPAIVQLCAVMPSCSFRGETFSGRGAIEAFHTGNFAKVRYSCTWTISVSMVDNLAAVWGDDACVETPKSGAPAQSWQGRWLTVYQLQPDGSWLIVRDSGEEAK